jgi:hypothetical protein
MFFNFQISQPEFSKMVLTKLLIILPLLLGSFEGMCMAGENPDRDKSGTSGPPKSENGPQTTVFTVSAGHSSNEAERGGFEPPVPCGTLVFETSTIGHSAISP